MADVTPWVRGACAHKGNPAADAECAVSEGCGDHDGAEYNVRFGEPQAFQSGWGFTNHPVERQSGSHGYLLVFATNDERLWAGGVFAQAGPMTVCVSFPNLDHWRCQDGEMGSDGLMRGFGTNNRGYDRPKP